MFTLEDGTEYHPQYFSDRFERLYKRATCRRSDCTTCGTVPRHWPCARAWSWSPSSAGSGHSAIRVTSDIYTTVLADVEREAAEATVSVVPRSRKRVLSQPQEEDEQGPGEVPDVPAQDAA